MALVRLCIREHLACMTQLHVSAFAALLFAASMACAETAADRSGAHGFDFLHGEWRVHHRIKRPSGEWYEFEGTCSTRALMGQTAVDRFCNGVGHIYSDYQDPQGKTVRGRLNWSQITPRSARWEQSSSTDGGKTWEPNWIMTFERL